MVKQAFPWMLVAAAACAHPAPPAPAPIENHAPAPHEAAPPSIDETAATGFDLYATPAAVAGWRIDGELRTDRLPCRIRGIAPGLHHLEILAPAGFRNHVEDVVVETGKASRVDITLDPLAPAQP